jgi:tRNA-specific 2-thiouridylase
VVKKEKVFVGMSGGVDSSVTAYLLKQQGYEVVGIFMKNWSGKLATDQGVFSFACNAQADYEDALAVAGALDIPFYSFDFEKEYREKVIGYFECEIKKGHTPNPDIMCNKEIKFKLFLDKCLALGADKIATGHYARVKEDEKGFHLLRGMDPNKDQSYFLATLGQYELSKTLFPIGELKKTEVRRIAKQINLPNAEKPDSQGICFVGEIDVNAFIRSLVGEKEGDIVDMQGKVLGKHKGLYFYTMGQRKGLGIGGGIPYFVVGKDLDKNLLVVDKGMQAEELFSKEVEVLDFVWTSGLELKFPWEGLAQQRYRSTAVPCRVEKISKDKLKVIFKDKQRAVTAGQFMVLYEGEELIGVGVIA